MSIVGRALLFAMGRADAAVDVEDDPRRRATVMHTVGPNAGKIGTRGEVFLDGQNLRLEQARRRRPQRRPASSALAYNLANFMRTLALPKEVEHWSLTTLRETLVKIGANVVSHGRYVTFQLAEVAVPRELFRKILSLIDDLRRRPAPA